MWRVRPQWLSVRAGAVWVNKLEEQSVWEKKRLSQCDCKWPKQAHSLSSGKRQLPIACQKTVCWRWLTILYDNRTSNCKSKIQLNKWPKCPTVWFSEFCFFFLSSMESVYMTISTHTHFNWLHTSIGSKSL